MTTIDANISRNIYTLHMYYQSTFYEEIVVQQYSHTEKKFKNLIAKCCQSQILVKAMMPWVQ